MSVADIISADGINVKEKEGFMFSTLTLIDKRRGGKHI
jgi:hypothetical protein